MSAMSAGTEAVLAKYVAHPIAYRAACQDTHSRSPGLQPLPLQCSERDVGDYDEQAQGLFD